MTNARKKQPDQQLLDLTALRNGSQFFALVETWTYSGVKNEDVFSRKLTIKFRATDFNDATAFVRSIAAVIGLAHEVWECNVRMIAEEPFYGVGEAA